MKPLSDTYVEETRFGFWFLRSHTWQHHVLRVAINDLCSLFSNELPSAPVLLDAGCGQGKSFQYLQKTFAPQRLIGLDADPLKRGVDTFRCYVEGWYAGTFQDVIFHPGSSPQIRRMISAILAGYAWDERNPFVSEPKRRLRMLSDICATEPA